MFELAVTGKVAGVVGSLPRATFSGYRGVDGLMRFLRAKEGPGRFGVEGLSGKDRQRVFVESVGILRTLFLAHVAREVIDGKGFRTFCGLGTPAT